MNLPYALHMMATQPRPFSTSEVLGMASRHGLENAVSRGEIVRVLPGLYASAIHSNSWLVQALAATAWVPASVLSGASALCACGALNDAPVNVEVVAPRIARRRYPQWIAARRSDLGTPTVPWIEGRTMVSPPFAVAIGYGGQPLGSRAELVYGPVRSGLVSAEDIAAAARALPRVRARRSLMERLDLAGQGVESFLEERGAQHVLTGAEFRGLVRQDRVSVARASYRVDAFHAPTLTAFEFDGARFHAGRRAADARRDAALASVGVLTVRFGYADIVDRPHECRALAIQIIKSREGGRAGTW